MGEEYESQAPTLKLPFLATIDSPEHPSGTQTPPLQTLASVPFKWEETPGKPRNQPDKAPQPDKLMMELQLPPCLSMDRIPKTPSPTTVLDGPYDMGRPKFSSFRFFRDAQIDSIVSPRRDDVDSMLVHGGHKSKGYFGSFRFSSSSATKTKVCDGKESCAWKKDGRREESFTHASSSNHIWGAIYKGLKQVIPWKTSKKSKKQVNV